MQPLSQSELLAFQKRNDVTFHVEQIQGITTLEPYHRELTDAVTKYQRIAIKACHDVGKTYISARVVLALGSSFPGIKIITTAPTGRQVTELLWSEIRSGFRDSKRPLGGKMMTQKWTLSEDWFVIGFKPKDETSGEEGQGAASRFQGFHGQGGIVVIFDEATGVPPAIWDQAEGLMTQDKVLWICIGNPTTKQCRFYSCFESPVWHKMSWDCFKSPNLIANNMGNLSDLMKERDILSAMSDDERFVRLASYKVPRPVLLTVRWVMERLLEWGASHPLFQSKILAAFPDEDEYSLITLGTVEAAMLRDPDTNGPVRIGVDVARYGSDATCLTVIQGNTVVLRKLMRKKDTTEVAGEVMALVKSFPGVKTIVVDATGLGSGVVDRLIELQSSRDLSDQVEVREVQFGGGFESDSLDKAKYVNLKSKMYVLLAQDLKARLVLPDESVYLQELPPMKFKFDAKGRYYMESKDEYKKRTKLGSPDSADSLALANYGNHPHNAAGEFTDDLVESKTSTIAGNVDDNKW